MPSYVALFRGINVSGQKTIRMEDLKTLFEDLGFERIQTYIQSGNVVFSTDRTATPAIVTAIEKGVRTQFGLQVAVVLRTGKELAEVVSGNPFPVETGKDAAGFHVTFLATAPDPTALDVLRQVRGDPDEIRIGSREIYLYCPGGYGRTKFNNTTIERKLGTVATTRNWKTVLKLLEMLGGKGGPA